MSEVKKLIKLFETGELKKEDGDVVIFDRQECQLQTDKPFGFVMHIDILAWELLEILGVNVSADE